MCLPSRRFVQREGRHALSYGNRCGGAYAVRASGLARERRGLVVEMRFLLVLAASGDLGEDDADFIEQINRRGHEEHVEWVWSGRNDRRGDHHDDDGIATG